MANNVYYNINFDLDAGQTEILKKTMAVVETEEGEMKWKNWTAEELPIYPVPYDEKDWYGWGCEQMGAKWVLIEDYSDNNLSGHSAWSPPNPMFEHLGQYICDLVGNDVEGTMTYEDEFRNYIGKTTLYTDDNQVIIDVNEIDGEELHAIVQEAFGFADDFEIEWWDMYKVKKGTYAGEEWEPQQYMDEVVYEFFDSERLGVL